MTVGLVPTVGNHRKTYRHGNLHEFSRTLIAAAQMVGDGLILTALSYVSFRFVIYRYHGTEYIQYFPYFVSTIGATMIMILGFARMGVYDAFEEFKRVGILRTVKWLAVTILVLTACLFVLKVSDNVSRLWLATWSITSAIALCGFRLVTASAARGLSRCPRVINILG